MNKDVQNPSDTMSETEQRYLRDKCVVTGIYGLRNKTNGKWYVGYSKNIYKRWNEYRLLDCQNQVKLFRALQKWGYENFEKTIIEQCSTDVSIWGPLETHWISQHNSVADGYNISSGGPDGPVKIGDKRTKEVVEKVRKAITGKPCSEETKRKISLSLAGRKCPKVSESNRTRPKWVQVPWNKGKKIGPHSLEWRQKISESGKRARRKNVVTEITSHVDQLL